MNNIIKRGLGAVQNLITRGFGLISGGGAGPGSPTYYTEYLKYNYTVSLNLKGRKRRKSEYFTLPLAGIHRTISPATQILKGTRSTKNDLAALLKGSKKIEASKVLPMKGIKKHTFTQLPRLFKGIKLNNSTVPPAYLKGVKERPQKLVETALKGSKDIAAILEVLDL
jgi:hypothetical protein